MRSSSPTSESTPYAADSTRCAFVCLDWASAVWDSDPQIKSSLHYFVGLLRDVFEYPAMGKDVSVLLLELRQGVDTAADYAIKFHTLTAQSGWNDTALLAVFREGLHPTLQAEIVCHDTDTTLSNYISVAVRLGNLRPRHQTPVMLPSPFAPWLLLTPERTTPTPLISGGHTSPRKTASAALNDVYATTVSGQVTRFPDAQKSHPELRWEATHTSLRLPSQPCYTSLIHLFLSRHWWTLGLQLTSSTVIWWKSCTYLPYHVLPLYE
ncbi:hypothetical protein QTP70_006895 [Hemibagrus guttatus]|uniref:Retrotransposon gag domain-containing protein n=1 Tax=Hemibagrus guttatus TaxID=175788 RepID=A0AAE0VAS1_9TELE|nr:hypothetical protein QTP70_006895 [Hemibagrus guttatus]